MKLSARSDRDPILLLAEAEERYQRARAVQRAVEAHKPLIVSVQESVWVADTIESLAAVSRRAAKFARDLIKTGMVDKPFAPTVKAIVYDGLMAVRVVDRHHGRSSLVIAAEEALTSFGNEAQAIPGVGLGDTGRVHSLAFDATDSLLLALAELSDSVASREHVPHVLPGQVHPGPRGHVRGRFVWDDPAQARGGVPRFALATGSSRTALLRLSHEAGRSVGVARGRTKIANAESFVLSLGEGAHVDPWALVVAYENWKSTVTKPPEWSKQASTITKDLNKKWKKNGTPWRLEGGRLLRRSGSV